MKLFKIFILATFWLVWCIIPGQKALAQVEPQVKMLSMPLPVLQPEVEFLSQEPFIDGQLDANLLGLTRRQFAFMVKMNPSNPDTKAEYCLAYGSDFLYLFIDLEADKLICRDRGYQNGDGFILVLNRPRPENAKSDELFMLGYHPTGKPYKPFFQMVWKRNDDWLFSPLGERSTFVVKTEGGHAGFELLLRWTDVHPFHPWLAEGIGFNLIFSQAIGDTEVNFMAVTLNPIPGPEAFNAYSRISFAVPAPVSENQCAAILEQGHIVSGEPLRVKIAATSARPVREELDFTFISGEGTRVSRQTVGIDLDAGVCVRNAALDTNDLSTGGYIVGWESRKNKGFGQTGLSVLPNFDTQAKKKECLEAANRISTGSVQTIRFLLAEIDAEREKLKLYDTAAGLRVKIERVNDLLRAAASGNDCLAQQKGFLRRAFQSQVDGTLQPYTIHVPPDLETGKTYPAIVYLHGSDSDDQSIKLARQTAPQIFLDRVFIIAPFGRGPSNAFSRDHAQEDIREAVADALQEYPIDPQRLVLSGFSMGGYGVYRTLYENPKMYAAASVFSGHPELASKYTPGDISPDFRLPEFLKPLRGMNIAVIHGSRDRNCPVEITTDLVTRMKKNGIPVLFLLDREAGHEAPKDSTIISQYQKWLKNALHRKK